MQSISHLLSKFKNLEHPSKKKEILSQIIFSETGLRLKKDQFDLRNKTLFIKADGYIKTELYLRKEALLEKIQANYPEVHITDIH